MEREVRRIALALYEANGTALSLSCAILLRHGEFRQLCEKAVNPNDYNCPDLFFRDSSSVNFLSKFAMDVGIDRRAVALQAFRACEVNNALTNVRLRRLNWGLDGFFVDENDMAYMPFIRRARAFIRRVLGSIPERIEPAFGPGSTFADVGRATTVAHKMSTTPTVTRECWAIVEPLWKDKWREAFVKRSLTQLPEFVRGNRFLTVPKNAKTDRPICVEPSLNMYFQKALGAHIRKRLKLVGVDLERGQDLHRHLLERYSHEYSTIDLSSASDTICSELVKLLLPSEWFSLLDGLRCRYTLVDGRWERQQKFSSMGNGFTFELETLVFLALVFSLDPSQVIGWDLSVYGDDIIVRPQLFDAACAVLKFFGFTPNPKKSFKRGYFKESCGFDIFGKQPTRSFYLKKAPNEPQDYFTILNGLRRLADRYSGDYVSYDRYRVPWLRTLDCVPTRLRRLRGPLSLGDSVIYDKEARGTTRKRDPGKTFFEVLVSKPQQVPLRQFARDVQLAAVLYDSRAVSGGLISLRGSNGYRISSTCHF